MDLVTYLAFDGNCEEAFRHYEKILGGHILMMMRNADAPGEHTLAPDMSRRIMHARMQVGERLLMGGDSPPGHYAKPQGFCTHVMVDDPGEAERIFAALSDGGSVTIPMAETFWARRFGMATDRFGIPWMVNCEFQNEFQTSGVEPATKPFVISRTFDVPREMLWSCFTDAERMKQWWGPKGAKIVAATMNLQPGGMFLYGMQTADGKTMWGRMVYREISPPAKIVFVNSFSNETGGLTRHPLSADWPIELLSTFDFVEADGRTTFTVTWLPLHPSARERATFEAGHDSMTQGWTGTLDNLSAYLAAL